MTKLLKCAGIYILTNSVNGNCYVGKDVKLGSRAKRHLSLKTPGCRAIHRAIKKHGRNAFEVQLIPYPNISHDALCEVERWKIRQLGSHGSHGGYNLTFGGDGVDSETVSENNLKRVADGTHNLLGGEINRKRVADGTHHLLGGEIARENALKRVVDGTHNLLGGEINRKRVADSTHNLLRKNNQKSRPEYEQVYTEFILSLPLGIKKARQRLFEMFSEIPQVTIYRWVAKWQAELA